MTTKTKITAMLLCLTLATSAFMSGCASSKSSSENDYQDVFATSLDIEKSVSLEISGYMGNFEALDSVINDFNEYYPNVTITYEQNDQKGLADYLKNNDHVDIFMTSDANVRSSDDPGLYAYDYCLDLSNEDIETDAIDPELLKSCTVNGHLVRIPLAKTMCGMVVNKTLLEKEGLSIPQNYEEFISACRKLKDAGYTPIQSSKYHAYSDMILPMAMSILGNDSTLSKKVISGDTSYADSLSVVYERLEEIISNGYTDYDINSTYPDNNYDAAILTFFDGNVPFWIATTESFSGMKKRESKSETFSADPFEYEFVNVPLGDHGVYDYEEPWYGFSVNRNSQELDYAVEFMRFLMTEKELNSLAEIKGMPAVTINNSDARFTSILNPSMLEARYVLNGSLPVSVTAYVANAANRQGSGTLADAKAAIEYIKEQ